jgi:6-phosphogluconolactonase
MHIARFSLLAAATMLAACSDATGPAASASDATLNANASADAGIVGGVFTQTNSSAGNAIVAYARRADGSLSYLGSYPTGGLGTAPAAGLGSQGAVMLTPNERFVFAVNAGSDQISGFAVAKDGLTPVTIVGSGGQRPVSVAVTNHILYALNAAGNTTLAGFRIGNDGGLTQVASWTRTLGAGVGAAEVLFSRDDRFLVVIERAAAAVVAFQVNPDGSLGPAHSINSAGPNPFGFDITAGGQVVVSEPGANHSATSFTIGRDGTLTMASGPVAAGTVALPQLAPCWVVITNDGRYAYTANAQSGSVSAFAVGRDGSLALVTHADGRPAGTTGPNTGPLDMDVSRNSRFLYVIEGRTGNIMGFEIGNDGLLSPMPDALPPATGGGRGGLAAY